MVRKIIERVRLHQIQLLNFKQILAMMTFMYVDANSVIVIIKDILIIFDMKHCWNLISQGSYF